ncbi:hypothetical protein DF3PB_2050003 [uncultured Defluviicoccus sp.]|uniref:Uncharacterized protein n=1 Tax=metagenome TaxID=256318 RepID=A0A380TBD2_9ZZZZ|nr:hypothetical protein DF3PB_2050003 [uncultured Defluviicoccus sp.]
MQYGQSAFDLTRSYGRLHSARNPPDASTRHSLDQQSDWRLMVAAWVRRLRPPPFPP